MKKKYLTIIKKNIHAEYIFSTNAIDSKLKMSSSNSNTLIPMMEGRVVAGATWWRRKNASSKYGTVIQFKVVEEQKKSTVDASKSQIRDLQSVLYHGLLLQNSNMLLYNDVVRIRRTIGKLVDPTLHPKKKNEIVLAYDVFMSDGMSKSSKNSISMLASCVEALGIRCEMSHTRSVIFIHADGPKDAPSLTMGSIKYLYDEFKGKTNGSLIAAIYILTASLTTQALLNVTTKLIKGLDKVHVIAKRSSAVQLIKV